MSPEIAEQNTPASTPDNGCYRLIPIEQIDPPDQAIRETMDETKLEELMESIVAIGLRQPLNVEQHGDRYRVTAGHRRLIACQALKYSPVPCLVYEPGGIAAAAVTVAENYYREDPNPAEEAIFLQKLLDEQCHNDIELLARIIRHRVEYCDDRLQLLRGDAKVLEALREKRITLAVARELNRFKDPGKRIYALDAALRGGATAGVVRQWRADMDALPAIEGAAGVDGSATNGAAASIEAFVMRCFFCDEKDHPEMMRVLYLHEYCEKAVRRVLQLPESPAREGS